MVITSIAALFLALGALWWWRTTSNPATTENQKSVAVLSFDNLSEDKANDYFATGMQDEIVTKLAQLRNLKVVSRSSTAKYQQSPAIFERSRAS